MAAIASCAGCRSPSMSKDQRREVIEEALTGQHLPSVKPESMPADARTTALPSRGVRRASFGNEVSNVRPGHWECRTPRRDWPLITSNSQRPPWRASSPWSGSGRRGTRTRAVRSTCRLSTRTDRCHDANRIQNSIVSNAAGGSLDDVWALRRRLRQVKVLYVLHREDKCRSEAGAASGCSPSADLAFPSICQRQRLRQARH